MNSEPDDDEDTDSRDVEEAIDVPDNAPRNLKSEVYANDGDHSIAGPGPHIFYCWSEAIFNLVEFCGDDPYFTVKSSALEAWSKVSHLPKADRVDALWEHMDIVRSYDVSFDDSREAREKPGAQLLRKAWRNLLDGEKARRGDRKEKEGEGGWWYEMVVQREKPEDGTAGLEVELEDQGTWWVVAINATDKDSHIAMNGVGQILCNGAD